MSIEFKSSRWGRNRNSRVFKKTRRAAMNRIDATHLPMRVHTGKNIYWSQTSNYTIHIPYGNIHKFLKARIGQPINKVFTEFLTEARKFRHADNLEEAFYSCIDYTERKLIYGKAEGFYISNGILNYKNDFKDKKPTPEKFIKYNEEHWDYNVFDTFKPLHSTGPYPIGKFWVEIKGQYMLLPVYIVYGEKWNFAHKQLSKLEESIFKSVWNVKEDVKYDYLRGFTRCSIIGKGDWYKFLKSFIRPADWYGHDDYNYFYYIVRISDIEKYKKETFKK